MSLELEALVLGAIGFGAGLAGAIAGALRRPSDLLMSYVQHFAAGFITAAAALEVLPEARRMGEDWPLLLGFALGIAFMVGLRSASERLGHGHAHEGHEGEGQEANVALIAALAVAVLADGAIIGISLSAGEASSTLIAVALATELIFICASTSGSLSSTGSPRGLAAAVGGLLALMLPIGSVLGAVAFAGASTSLLVGALGFAAVVLFFVAIEELLLEAHERAETAGTATTLFGAFLLFLGLVMWLG